MTSRYLLPALRAVRDGAIEPSPSPALIDAFAGSVHAEIAQRVIRVLGERPSWDEIGGMWERAKASQTRCDPEQLFYQHPGECEVEASAKGGDTNSGPSRSERSPDMTSAVSGGYQLGEQPSGAAGGNLTTTRTYPAKLPEPPKTLEDETIEMLRQDQARRTEAPRFNGRTEPIPGCPCAMCSSLRIVRRVAFAQAAAFCEQAAQDFEATYADKHADAARYIARGLRARAEEVAK